MRSDYNPELLYATFWQRLTAFMLDIFIIVVPVTFLMMLTLPLFFDLAAVQAATNKEFEAIYQFVKNGVYVFLAGYAAISFALALFTISRWQATPGKRIVNIYIARKTGEPVSFGDAFGRFFSLPLFILMIEIFKRRETYIAMEELKQSGKISTDLTYLQNHLNGPATQATGIVVFAVIILWFIKIFFSRERMAMHDNLFNTRVFQGKK